MVFDTNLIFARVTFHAPCRILLQQQYLQPEVRGNSEIRNELAFRELVTRVRCCFPSYTYLSQLFLYTTFLVSKNVLNFFVNPRNTSSILGVTSFWSASTFHLKGQMLRFCLIYPDLSKLATWEYKLEPR